MFLLLPIGVEDARLRRLPVVSIAVALLTLVVFALTWDRNSADPRDAQREFRIAIEYWAEYPYLTPPQRFVDRLPKRAPVMMEERARRLQSTGHVATPAYRALQQEKLDAMCNAFLAKYASIPGEAYTLVPARGVAQPGWLTYMLLHGGWGHLLGNLWLFYLVGPLLETVWRSWRFVFLYVIGGVVAGVSQALLDLSSPIPILGASGAVAACMGAFTVRFAARRIRMLYFFFFRFGLFGVPAWLAGGLWLANELASLYFYGGSAGVAVLAHLGGFGFGVLVALVLRRAGEADEPFVAPAAEEPIGNPVFDAVLAQRRGDLPAAREAWKRVLRQDPRNLEALSALVRIARQEDPRSVAIFIEPLVAATPPEDHEGSAIRLLREVGDYIDPAKLKPSTAWLFARKIADPARAERFCAVAAAGGSRVAAPALARAIELALGRGRPDLARWYAEQLVRTPGAPPDAVAFGQRIARETASAGPPPADDVVKQGSDPGTSLARFLELEPSRPPHAAKMPPEAPSKSGSKTMDGPAAMTRGMVFAGIAGGFLTMGTVGAVAWTAVHTFREGGEPADASAAVLDRDVASLRERLGAPAEPADALLVAGRARLRSDQPGEWRAAYDELRKSAIAAADPSEALAGAVIAASILPRSERDGLTNEQAASWVRAAKARHPDSTLAIAADAALLSSLGRRDAAAEATKPLVERDPLAAWIHGHALAASDAAGAAMAFRRALAQDPSFALAATSLAEVELSRGDLRGAADALELRGKATPSSRSERVRAEIELRLGNAARALASARRAVELDPKDVEARLALGWMLASSNDPAGARAAARHVLDVDRPSQDATIAQGADAGLLLADVLRREGKFADALASVASARDAHPRRAAVLHQKGLASLGAGAHEAAYEALKAAAQLEPDAAPIQIALGIAAIRTEHANEALAAFEAALALDPADVAARAGIAAVHADAGNRAGALAEWEKLALTPRPLRAWMRPLADPRLPRPPLDAATHVARLRVLETAAPGARASFRLYEAIVACEDGRPADAMRAVASVRLDAVRGATLAGCALAANRPADALRLTTGAARARELAARGWALRVAKDPGSGKAFAAAIRLDPGEPYAALGIAADLVARGRMEEAESWLRIAESALGSTTPAVVKVRWDSKARRGS